MAEINYLKSFIGNTERDFAQSYEGINYVHNAPLQIYLRGYIKHYQKEYEGTYIKQYSGDYIKHYQKEYAGTYTKLYLGDYVKTYLKQYDKQYEKNWSTNWEKAYSGQYTKTYLGEYTHQWSGNYTKEYTGNYDGPQYYSGNTVGQFDKIYEGFFTGYFARDGVGSYLKQWEGAYEHDWIGVYIKQYQKEYQGEWSSIRTVNYQKEYVATWLKQYTQSFTGFVDTTRNSAVNYNVDTLVNYTKTYVGNWTKNYEGAYNKQWSHQYLKTYLKEYDREWLGLYDHQWHGAYGSGTGFQTFHHNYVGYYTGYFQGNYQGDWIAYYVGSYVKDNFIKQYDSGFDPIPGTPGRPALPAGYYEGEVYPFPVSGRFPTSPFPGLPGINYDSNYSGDVNYEGGSSFEGPLSYYIGSFVKFFEGTTSPGGGPEEYAKTYTRIFLGAWQRTDNYSRYFTDNYEKLYSGTVTNYISNQYTKTWSKTWSAVYVESEPGVPPSIDYQGYSRAFVQGNYIQGATANTYVGSEYIRTYSRSYLGNYNANIWTGVLNYHANYVVPLNYTTTLIYSRAFDTTGGEPNVPPHFRYEAYTGPTVNYGGTIAYVKAYVGSYDKGWEKNWQSFSAVNWERDFIGYTGVQYDGIFEAQYSKQYEGVYIGSYIKEYVKEYEKHYEKTYMGYSDHEWIGYYDAYYQGTVYSIRNSSETYLGGYLNQFDGPQWTKEYDGLTYNKQYAKEYEGTYEGVYNKQYSKEYEGAFQKDYLGMYDKVYTSEWEGVYSRQFTRIWSGGPYDIQYEGIYTKQYEGQFDKQYEGAFDKQYEGTFTKQYNSADFITQYSKQYTKEYEKLYVGNYEKEYEGVFLKQYSTGYIQQYSKEYDGTYVKQYEKVYGGAWTGVGPAYEGLAYFTNTYAGTRTFHQTYLGTTSDISTRTGNLTDNVGIRVKEDGKFKPVQRTRVKVDGEWKIVQTTRIKEDGVWKVAGIDYDRIELSITSNTANYNIGDQVNALISGSLYDKPRHVVVTINEGVHVYSTNPSTPALDTSFVTQTDGADHKVKLLLQSGAKILGAAGQPGTQDASTRTGNDGTDGGNAILLRDGVDLFIESYGTIAGGGGGGGSGGYPISGSSASQVGGLGGHGAGWDPTLGYISESDSDRNGTNSSVNYGIHGGNGGLLGQLGIGAGGFVDDDASKSQTNPGTNYTQYARSGNGGEPGSAIKGYDASRVTFINSTESSVWGDSAFKFKA